ncbi:U3 small nucleolar ribonucleoprotein mpp10 [Cladobotryum mycophilum]|uniref:U3 small nucleolar ribonucleoprotein protein MPP10 n=1 Tax=Cladobotryum mycophilum TaxID=491253 RepID=A0ABR0S6H8_9HYPO
MAANTSPCLTSSSHTLDVLPIMVPPSSNTNGEVLALLESLRPDKRHVFLQPNVSLPTEALNVVRDTLEGFAAHVSDEQQQRLKESRKRKREGGGGGGTAQDVLKLRKVYVDGFETGQVWQQAKKIIGSVLAFSENLLDELEENNQVVTNGVAHADLDESALLDDESQDEEDEEEDSLDEDEDDEDAEEDLSDEQLSEDGLEGEFDNEEDELDDAVAEEQDAKGDPNTDRASDDEDIDWTADPMAPSKDGPKKSSKRNTGDDDNLSDAGAGEEDSEDEDDGPTFGDMALDAPEGDSEDEDMDEMVDDEGNDFNANEVYYRDFFAPPPRKGKYKDRKPKKSVKFEPKQPAEEDVERAMADVRRDLFDDESENEGSDDALSDVSAGDPRSRRSAHERRQAKLADEIRKLEAASVAKREWALSGEATAAERPMNSLLEEDLDFEHVGKPVPVITPEVTEGIEDLIKRRILAQQFDEVLRRRPDSENVPNGTRRGMIELDDSKATKSLAEIYEEEHVKNTNPDSYVSASDEKLQKEEKEIEAMWKDVSARLDALSSWHYKPKPAAPTLSVVADVATVAMEDAQPSTALGVAGESSRMAPQEIYKSGADTAAQGEVVTSAGLPIARQEMTREEKLRRRRRAKERVRKAGAEAVAAAKGKKPLSGKAKMQRDTIAELKKGGVKVINRKGEITDVEGNKAKVAKVASSGSYKL